MAKDVAEGTVLFVDMLGFATLLEDSPDAVEELEPIFQPLTTIGSGADKLTASSPLVSQFSAFHIALEERIRTYLRYQITAITFSDSAFVFMPNPVNVIFFARSLMRDLLKSKVPARMGIGAGSFAALRFMSDNTADAHIHSTQFLGTAVVRAYKAESCGITGMRILLHPSVKPFLKGQNELLDPMPLDETRPEAYGELNYLAMRRTRNVPLSRETIDKRFVRYRDYTIAMRNAAPQGKRHYYDNTITALRRMRDRLYPE